MTARADSRSRSLRAILLAAALVVACTPSRGHTVQRSNARLWPARSATAELPAADRVRLAEAFRLAESLGDSVWPGWSAAPFPVLLITADREFLMRHPRPSADFARVGHDTLLGTDVFTRPRLHSAALLATFPAVGGVPTIVVGQAGLTGKRSSAWVLTVLHEHFHQLQTSRPGHDAGVNALGLANGDRTGRWMLDYAFPYDSAAVRARFAAFASALESSIASGPAAAEANRAVAAARDGLRAALSDADYRYLAFQMWQEGVARYTELRMARLAAERFTPSQAFRALPDFTGFDAEAMVLERQVAGGSRSEPLAGARRAAFQPAGAAMALVLDAVAPGWRTRYFESGFSLDPLLP